MESKKGKSPITEPVEEPSPPQNERLPMERDGYGTIGDPQEISTNYNRVRVNLPKKGVDAFYVHTVTLKDDDGNQITAKDIGRAVIKKVRDSHSTELGHVRFAYDGDNSLVTISPLPNEDIQLQVTLEGASLRRRATARDVGGDTSDRKRSRINPYHSNRVSVSIKPKDSFSFDSFQKAEKGQREELSQGAVRVIDTILKDQADKKDYLVFRQSFFSLSKILEFKHAVDIFEGFSSSFKATQGGLFLNTDVSHTLMVKHGPVINFLLFDQNIKHDIDWKNVERVRRLLRDVDWEEAERVLKGLRVKTAHNNIEESKIIGLSENSCREQTFVMKQRIEGPDGRREVKMVKLTVYEYFVRHKNQTLDWSGNFRCVDIGTPKHPVYIPLELCKLVKFQRYSKALSTQQRSLLVEKSRLGPSKRKENLEKEIRHIDYDSHEVLCDSGFSVETRFTSVDGRILPAPKLKSGDGKDLIPRNGRWNFNNQKLAQPAVIKSWLVADFSSKSDLKELINHLINCAENKGIGLKQPTNQFTEEARHSRKQASVRVDNMIRTMKAALNSGPTFILCVLQQKKNCDIYGPWKRRCLSDYGIPTQCIAPTGLNNQILTNVLLKINAKIGGSNFVLNEEDCSYLKNVSDKPTLILGMDVSHGPSGQAHMPSIAAVVSSMYWPSISRYRAEVRTQLPRQEVIGSLFQLEGDKSEDNGIFRTALRDFQRTSKSQEKPCQIIIFRDGVGESQFKKVLNEELEQMIQAWKLEYGEKLPKFTVIVAQKRHHTRFFLPPEGDHRGIFRNVPPGMIVDKKICHPTNNDFFLCAHDGRIGTSRPAHYHVLLDEIGFTVDELQGLVHSLCYIQQRSTAAVSVVAPICYAHLAAAQVAQMINYKDSSGQSPTRHTPRRAASSSQAAAASPRQASAAVAIPGPLHFHAAVADSMFFC